ncbi:MAG: DsbA family protein [Caldilineaceae bacterium]|nr:DsbA family protein [Caldilineaceae bacterium]
MSVSSPRAKRKISQPGHKPNNSLAIWLIGGAVVFVILLVIAINVNNAQPIATVTQPDLPAEWIDGTSMGSPDAPVVVEAYEDFLCPHCLQWTTTVKPRMFEEYIKAGQVRFVYRTFPLSGFAPASNMAAMASRCAADQGAFWPYHDRLFNTQREGQPGFTIERLIEYAAEIGLDRNSFTSCMTNFQHQADIEATIQEGVSRGVSGTPSVFVNGTAVSSDYPSLQAEIDRLLSAG